MNMQRLTHFWCCISSPWSKRSHNKWQRYQVYLHILEFALDIHWCTPRCDNLSSLSSWMKRQEAILIRWRYALMHCIIPWQRPQINWEVSNIPMLRSLAHPKDTLLSKLIQEGKNTLHDENSQGERSAEGDWHPIEKVFLTRRNTNKIIDQACTNLLKVQATQKH